MNMPLCQKEIAFNRQRAIDKIKETINDYSIAKENMIWTDTKIWNEIKNTFAIEGEEIKHQLFTKYLINGSQDDKNDFTNFKGIMNTLIESKPEINDSKLYELFIASNNAWQLNHHTGFEGYYRKGEVIITGTHMNKQSDRGLDNPKEHMNSLFNFINSDSEDDYEIVLKSIISHIQFAYIHPYYDMNGRFARLMNIWASLDSKYNYIFYFLSQSIQFSKPKYYRAIEESLHGTKVNYNTFIDYICDAILINNKSFNSIACKCDIKDLTQAQLEWALVIHTNMQDREFGWRDLTKQLNAKITKAGLLGHLNILEKHKILKSSIRKGTKFFEINK